MEEFGPPEVLVLREVADPVCGPGQVMIEVSFSSVTFVETQVRSGRAPTCLDAAVVAGDSRVTGSRESSWRSVRASVMM